MNDDGTVEMEGFLTKRAMASGRNWKRRYFVLKNNALLYFETQPTDANDKLRKPRGVVEVTGSSVVRLSPVDKPFAFELVSGPQLLVVHAAAQIEADAWMDALNQCIKRARAQRGARQDESRSGWLTKRAVRSRRNWRRRFFVLRNGRISYYEQPPAGASDKPRGVIELSGDAVVRETGTSLAWGTRKHAFAVEAGGKTLMLSAPTSEERTAWVAAVHLSALRKAGATGAEHVKAGLFLRLHGLEKHVTATVLSGGFETLDHLRRISEDDMRALFRRDKFSLQSARKFQLAVRKLRSMKPSEVAGFGLGALGLSARPLTDLDGAETEASERNDDGAGSVRSRRSHVSDMTAVSAVAPVALRTDREHRLYAWGDDSELQLGVGDTSRDMLRVPTHVGALRGRTEPCGVFAGATMMAAVTAKDGNVFVWGSGPLGVRDKSESNRPFIVAALRGIRVAALSIGERHVAAVTAGGDLYTWGAGEHGQLGQGNARQKVQEPARVEGVGSGAGVPVTAVSCAAAHTLVLADGGRLWTMGKGGHGRLGLGDTRGRNEPTRIESLDGHRIGRIATGDTFSLAVTLNGMACFQWGRLAGEQGPLVPVRMPSFDEDDRPVDWVAASSDCAAFVLGAERDDDNDDDDAPPQSSVFTLGGTGLLLGHGDDVARLAPSRVRALDGHGVVQVAVSPTHMAALCHDGRLLAWGEDRRGQLGSGHMLTTSRPLQAARIAGYRFVALACGYACTAALSEQDERVTADAGDESEEEGPQERWKAGDPLPAPPPPQADVDDAARRANAELLAMMERLSAVSALQSAGKRRSSSKRGAEPVGATPEEAEARMPLPEGTVHFAPGWLRHTDPNTGKSYYESLDTGAVQWQPPTTPPPGL